LSRSLLILALLGSLAVLPTTEALALDRGTTAGASAARQASSRQAVPFGGAYAPSQVGKRPQDLQRPGAGNCGPRAKAGAGRVTRQDAAGKVHVFNDPAGLANRNGNIYADCNAPRPTMRPGSKAAKPATAYNRSTNTLKAARDGYINRSATSAMMPRKAPSMYDPATGVLRPPKKLNDYQIYQQ
jgi:hypothetical protein